MIKKNRCHKLYCVMIFISIFILCISALFNNFNKVFYNSFDLICVGYSFALSVTALLKKKDNDNKFYKYIGCGFVFIFILNMIKVIESSNGIKFSSIYLVNGIDMLSTNFQIIIIAMACLFKCKELSIKRAVDIYFVLFLVCNLIFIIPHNDYMVLYEKFCIAFVIISEMIAIIYVVYSTRNKTITPTEKTLISHFCILILLQQILIILEGYKNDEYLYIAEIFKFYAHYIIYLIVANEILHNSYIKARENLEYIKTAQENLNSDLNTRNKTLIEMEKMIEKSEKRYGQLIESIDDGIIIFYFDKVYYINSIAMKIIGYDNYNELVDMKFDTFVRKILYKKMMSGNFSEIFNKLKKTENKDKTEVKIELPPINGAQYEIYIINIDSLNRFIYIKNITEINKIHEYKRKYRESLVLQESKKEFYSNISHELRTPINLIYSAIQLTEMNIKDDNINSIKKNYKTIKHNCLRLIRTINNFIDTNKISEGYLHPNLNVYNVVSIVENISLASNRYIEKVNNRLIFDSAEEEFYARCDKDMIERVVLNILSNSVKFAKNDGVIYIDISADDKKIYVNIKNTGYIVRDEIRPFLFDKFTKVNKSLNRKREGSGLGLYLSKELLELQGGTITVGSETKVGTEFLITLPRCYDASECKNEESLEMNLLDEKVDIEFSDIYL